MSPPFTKSMEEPTEIYYERKLPPEIVHMIDTDYANTLYDRRRMSHLLLVSQSFYTLSSPLLYGSLHLTNFGKFHLQESAPSSSVAPQRLHDLHVAFSMNTNLAKLTHTFFIDRDTERTLVESDWDTIRLIFPFLCKLKRLYLSPLPSTPSNLVRSLPENIQLTHFIYASHYQANWLASFLQTQQSLRYLSLIRVTWDPSSDIFSNTSLILPKCHTFHFSRESFAGASLLQLPSLEHAVVNSPITLMGVTNVDIMRRLKSLEISCVTDQTILAVMKCLECLEYLFAGLEESTVNSIAP
ncbi:hypothetical protein ONZ45_g17634 [Pleurotus djamor]|nr:hypothetical protein ONZ45_g17634 [Pleurotus djamor]